MLADIPKEWEPALDKCRIWSVDRQDLIAPRQFREDIKAFTCSRCGKPDRTMIHRCTKCQSIFIKDFAHPNWRIQDPQCFTCLDADTSRATEVWFMTFPRSHNTRIEPQLRGYYRLIIEPDFLDTVVEDFTF